MSASPLNAIKYAHQAEKLSHLLPDQDGGSDGETAVRAEFITPQDAIIVTENGGRLPGVPVNEAQELNHLKNDLGGGPARDNDERPSSRSSSSHNTDTVQKSAEGSLRKAMPPSRTNPLFPPLPLYGPPSLMRNIQCMTFRATSFCLSLAFLGVIVLGSAFTSIPLMFNHIWLRLTLRNPDQRRPFYEEEKRRKELRKHREESWRRRGSAVALQDDDELGEGLDGFVPTEGGKDPLICDAGYYARRVGLDIEEFKVQTEDGFIITLWHVYDPKEFTPLSAAERSFRGPEIFTGAGSSSDSEHQKGQKKYPVLMIHGLLQSAGAYCTNDDESLAFYLCKQGYDVWLGNNRCGFKPEHTLLDYADPRMWAWNIRQMGVMDLPALVSRVLSETGFEKLGLVCHSQGTTQTFVALAKEQRPDLGDKISVFCALAPAAYAGPLIGKMYFKFMRVISPAFFRLFFGIHAFIPFMMTMHATLPGKLYGAMGYRVFSFLFNWSDSRWDRGLRDRLFQFSPVYVSAESMRWWLGRECFAKQKCILSTREDQRQEDVEDEEDEYYQNSKRDTRRNDNSSGHRSQEVRKAHERKSKGSTAWYDERAPPFAMWIAGSDDLVDGRRLLRRFERGREPHVRLVHSKIIEEYEHLDVIWAMDCIEQVGREVKEVIWKTCPVRDEVMVPRGCRDIAAWKQESQKGDVDEQLDQSSSSEER
jgi:pimeloyl-ACP methyl ester carboxylesterase